MRDDKESGQTMLHNNPEYAKHWIEFLQKKNAVLNIVWPLLLIMSVLLLLASFYFFQNAENYSEQNDASNAVIVDLQAQMDELLEKLDSLESEKQSMAQQIKRLQTVKNNLEQQKGDSIERLDLSSKVTETLQETLRVLEDEKATMVDALKAAKAMLLKQEKNYSEQIANLQAQHSQSQQLSTKALSDRKTAYNALVKRQHEMQSEMDRLAAIVRKQSAELEAGVQSRSRMQFQLKEYKQRVATLQQEKAVADQQNQKAKPSIETPAVKPGDTAASDKSGTVINDGLDEIRAPVVKKEKPPVNNRAASSPKAAVDNEDAAVFDFESIVTE